MKCWPKKKEVQDVSKKISELRGWSHTLIQDIYNLYETKLREETIEQQISIIH